MSKKIGFTCGVYDLFHIGHLNLLENAKKHCDYLVVGVSTDEVVKVSKGKETVIPFRDRARIVGSIRCVDKVIPQDSYSIESKISNMINIGADILFVGSDWQGTEKWNTIERELSKIGKKVVYLPHTDGISSTILRESVKNDKK